MGDMADDLHDAMELQEFLVGQRERQLDNLALPEFVGAMQAWQAENRKCLVFECDKPEDVPGFCAEHADMVNAECDRLDKLRNAGQATDKPA